RSAAGILLAAVVPDDRRERSGAVRPEQKPGQRQAVALERDALLRGRGRLSGGGRDSDRERRHGAGEQRMHGGGQPTATGLEPSTPRTRVEVSPDLGDRMLLPNRTMLIDARTLAEGTTLEADICIAGAGAAGMTIALDLRGSGLSILLLESGGWERDEATQALSEGRMTGIDTGDLRRMRIRALRGPPR